ncbi:hypothetical protein [Lacisediminihabitans profunda]|uniref:hypothetical protein n=1 Tax=Lacisediminihabitans profunda TaxID=2594790 RepID=UPI00164F6DF0|nr:hypothetical protein [Lacisediminihabitans profunda]
MTRTNHPARRARALTGAASVVALVGIVAGLQMAANAQGAERSDAPRGGSTPTVSPSASPLGSAPTPAVPAPEAPAPAAPAAPAPAPKPVAPPVAAPAPAPVHGSTGGSGG